MVQIVVLTIFLASLVSTSEAELTNTLCPVKGSWLNMYNLITISDVDTNSDVEGSAFIGGDVVSGSSANFAIHLHNIQATEVSMEVAGHFDKGNAIQLSNGSGRTTDGNVKQLNNVQWKVHGRSMNLNDGNQGADFSLDPTLPSKASQIQQDLEQWSAELASLEANNSFQGVWNQPRAFKFIINEVDENGVAIFHVPKNKLFNNNKVQQIEFVGLNKASAILINVAGTDLELKRNFVGSAPSDTFRKKVIWNLYEANTFYAETMFNGALLAPYCVVDNRNTIDGSVAVSYLLAKSEIHLPLLDIGCEDAVFMEEDDPTFAPTSTPTFSPTSEPTAPERTADARTMDIEVDNDDMCVEDL